MFLCATLLCLLARTTPCQQVPATDPPPAAATTSDHSAPAQASPQTGDQNAADDHRIFGVLPNYKAVNDPDQPFSPISAKEKFALVRHYFDPFTFVFTGITAGFEQATNGKEGYGQGATGFGKRYGADFADGFTNELFVVGVFPSLLHEDPRYYRLGHGSGWKRTAYALSRILITRTDSGGRRFNTSEFLGNLASGGISMAYYPSNERSVSGVFSRMSIEIGYDSLFNLLKEFYPDLKRKRRH
ncbi:MAG TPA: hypothetical protein VFW44_19960 [Bryobacteraceae bacterium]|nr:hypothetical protein [Bryobacteraceae bacterium]